VTILETGDGVSPEAGRQLSIIALAMGAGLAMMAGLVFWTHINAPAKVPTPAGVKFINTLTIAAMVYGLLSIIGSEGLWRSILRRTPGALSGRVQSAFIVRMACREGGGLLGLTVAYLAALNGVLRAYPAYWVNLAPCALFLGFLAAHWPSAEKLTAEAREILGSGL
jgi:hypothetical protein